MKKPILFLASLVGIVIVLSFVQITLSNAFSTDGIILGKMQAQIDTLQKENMVLEEKVYTRESLTNIASQAASEGFVADTSEIVVSNTTPLAIKP